VDVERFQRKLAELSGHGHAEAEVCPACLSPLGEAAELYRDDFMSGFTLRDSPNFDDWQFFQTEGLRRTLAGALEKLARTYILCQEFEAAIPHARRWLALDPLHEPAHRQLMQLYAGPASGKRHSANTECVRVLESGVGRAAAGGATQLTRRSKSRQVGGRGQGQGSRGQGEFPWAHALLPRAPAPRLLGPSAHLLPGSPAPVFPLVGRSREWAALLTLYAELQDAGHFIPSWKGGRHRQDSPGREFMAYVRAQGRRHHCHTLLRRETNLAYGPFVEGLVAPSTRQFALRAGWRRRRLSG
jgi:hypothetical protein